MWEYQNHFKKQGQSIGQLDRIEVMVLLDLIGAANPRFVNFFPSTQDLFVRLSDIERSLSDGNVLDGQSGYMFLRRNSYSTIDDDHRPFMKKGELMKKKHTETDYLTRTFYIFAWGSFTFEMICQRSRFSYVVKLLSIYLPIHLFFLRWITFCKDGPKWTSIVTQTGLGWLVSSLKMIQWIDLSYLYQAGSLHLLPSSSIHTFRVPTFLSKAFFAVLSSAIHTIWPAHPSLIALMNLMIVSVLKMFVISCLVFILHTPFNVHVYCFYPALWCHHSFLHLQNILRASLNNFGKWKFLLFFLRCSHSSPYYHSLSTAMAHNRW